jgi:hypothetical protein
MMVAVVGAVFGAVFGVMIGVMIGAMMIGLLRYGTVRSCHAVRPAARPGAEGTGRSADALLQVRWPLRAGRSGGTVSVDIRSRHHSLKVLVVDL